MSEFCLSVSPVSCFAEDSTEFGQESAHAAQRTLPVIGNLRRNLSGLCDSDNDGRDPVSQTQLQLAFAKSSYGLADVGCAINLSTVHLFGIVKSYFALQMAIQLAHRIAASRCITLDIEVVPRLYDKPDFGNR